MGVGKRKWVPLVVGTGTGPMVPSTHASQKPGGEGRGLNLLGGSEAILYTLQPVSRSSIL